MLDFLDSFRISRADKSVLKETGKKSAAGKRLENDLITEAGVFVTVDRTKVAQSKVEEVTELTSRNISKMTNNIDETENLIESAIDMAVKA